MQNNRLTVSYTPHIRGRDNVRGTMLNVITALIPALAGGVYFFGVSSLILTLTSVAACLLFEYLWCHFTKKQNTTGDLSAVVTGMLLAFCVPPTLPPYMLVIASAFSILVVKCCFGGIGHNIVNPALAGRAFMLASWPVEMTNFTAPQDKLNLFADFTQQPVTGATPLAYLKGVEGAQAASYQNLFFGNISGCIGEVSCLLILIGGAYLLIKKVIRPIIPLTYLITVGLFGFLFGGASFANSDFLYHIMSGSACFAAFFMATDYTTTPVTKTGEFIFALGAGILTGVIRVFGGYPEGVTYAILLMNVCVPLIDKFIKPRVFGH